MGIEGTCEKCGGETTDYRCLNCTEVELERTKLQIGALKDDVAMLTGMRDSARQAYQRAEEKATELAKIADSANRLIEAFQKDCDCGDKNCCLRERQGRRGVIEKPSREGLCTNDRDGEKCLKLAGHEGICEGPENVWDWKPTLGKRTTIEKRKEEVITVRKYECGHTWQSLDGLGDTCPNCGSK